MVVTLASGTHLTLSPNSKASLLGEPPPPLSVAHLGPSLKISAMT